jgi:GNAT superfamily N-acetyltransferase
MLTIREATSDDSRAIRKVQVATWKSTYRGLIPDQILDSMENSPPRPAPTPPHDVIAASRRTYVACVERSGIVGFLSGGKARDSNWGIVHELWAIYVLEAWQGHGIGRKLVSAFATCLGKECDDFIVWCLAENRTGRHFYESLGGILLDIEKEFQWNGLPVAREVAYRMPKGGCASDP